MRFYLSMAVLGIVIISTTSQRSTFAADVGETVTTGLLRVWAMGEQGEPLPGVKIHASVWTNEKFQANRDYVCDASGRAFVELPRTLHILRVWARAPGRVPQFVQLWSKEQSKLGLPLAEQLMFRLEKGTSLGGTVKKMGGQPVAGARVEVMYVEPVHDAGSKGKAAVSIWLSDEQEPSCITDSEGRWSLDNVPAGAEVEVLLKVSHGDFVSDHDWGILQRKQAVTMKALRDKSALIVLTPRDGK